MPDAQTPDARCQMPASVYTVCCVIFGNGCPKRDATPCAASPCRPITPPRPQPSQPQSVPAILTPTNLPPPTSGLQLSSCPYIVVILPSPEPPPPSQERGPCASASASACASACARARYIPSPARPSGPSPWGLFLIRPSQNKPTPQPISPFRPGKRRAPDIGPPYLCTPRCVPPPESPHANSHKPAGLRIHPPSLDQPAPSNPSRWHHLFSPSPKKVSDTTREIRIVAAPAHLLPSPSLRNWPSPASRSKRTTRPVALPACRPVLFSGHNGHEACFSCGAAVDGISRRKWAASTTAAFPSFLLCFV
ncbi:hypothetical protein F5883DRAFT_227063 [Diaporthe sp. PMI_573]|nr:hypothetical protein F5883DRAFT_227063 [Diaporthaceae sp. PMI_573]